MRASRVPVRCALADVAFRKGTMETRTVIFDTTDTIIGARGQADFADEQLDLKVTPVPKDMSPVTARVPFDANGLSARAEGRDEVWPLDVSGDIRWVSVVSMGNPHAVQIVDDVDAAPVAIEGPEIENSARFPARAAVRDAAADKQDRQERGKRAGAQGSDNGPERSQIGQHHRLDHTDRKESHRQRRQRQPKPPGKISSIRAPEKKAQLFSRQDAASKSHSCCSAGAQNDRDEPQESDHFPHRKLIYASAIPRTKRDSTGKISLPPLSGRNSPRGESRQKYIDVRRTRKYPGSA